MTERVMEVRAGDTEPIDIDLDPDGDASYANLDTVSAVLLYARLEGGSTNHVNGVSCVVADSPNKIVRFDPLGNGPGGANAFDTGDEGTYYCYVRVTWTDDDVTRHPPGEEELRLDVIPNYE